MAFQVPSLADVSRTIENGFSSAFYGTSGTLRVGVLKVLSKVVAGGCYLPILCCQYIFKNSFIDTCDVENLVRFGGWYNLPHKVASLARGMAQATFTKAATIPSGSILIDLNTNDEYEVQDDVVNTNTTTTSKTFNVVALKVGSQANRETGNTTLELRDISVDGVTFKSMNIGGGASYDVSVNGIVEQWGEDVDSYRKRLKFRRQHQPMGGCDADYKQWAEKFSFVTDAFVFGNYPSTNDVLVACADYNGNISVNSTNIAEVKNYITSDSRKPITANVSVASVKPVSIALTIGLSGTGGNMKTNIASALKKTLKGFGFGSVLTTTLVQRILVENGVCDTCSVTKISVGSIDYTANGYTLAKNYNEVVDINTIEKNLTLVEAN